MRQIIYILCEGKTEYNYVQSLNKLLRQHGDCNALLFIPNNLEGKLTHKNCKARITNKIKKLHKDSRATACYAWLDYDIFQRLHEENRRQKILESLNNIKFQTNNIRCIFNHMNGEDFIILHKENNIIKQWENVCIENNHFKNPMPSKDYLTKFKELVPKYKKGDTPALTPELLNQCINNIQDSSILFKSDVDILLQKVFDNIKQNNTQRI